MALHVAWALMPGMRVMKGSSAAAMLMKTWERIMIFLGPFR